MDAKALLERATQELFARDANLPNSVNERTLTYRLAMYLEAQLRLLDEPHAHLAVDCEYNRAGDDPKRLMDLYRPDEAGPWDVRAVTVYPDIIVHERGTNKHNRIVVEVKVKGRGSSGEAECNRDREKLRRLRSAFGYVDAFFVLLDLREKAALIETID